MNSRKQLSSPSPSKFKTQLSIASNSNLQTQRSGSKLQHFQDLYLKFMTINNQVTIDHDQSAFNLIEYNHKDNKHEYDQELALAKLKRLENNAQLKRIDMELQNRKKKLSTKHKHHQFYLMNDRDKYVNTYRDLAEKKITLGFQNQVITDSDDDDAHTQRPKGITHFEELKKHPKLLKYTVQQAKSREKLKFEEVNSKKQKVQQFKNELRIAANGLHHKIDRNKQKGANPQKVAENIFRRFYAKKNKQKSIEQARSDSRVGEFLERQQDIINSVDERSLSKENYQKLKQRMKDIASQLYEDEKKHKSKTKLPKINAGNRSTISK